MREQTEFAPALPDRYGFGIEIMKKTKVCTQCGTAQAVSRYICARCGEKLPQQTLFQIYQRRHRLCPVCDTVLTPRMKFCPHCGEAQNNENF